MIALTLSKYANQNNPDRIFLSAAFSGSYVAGGDTLNLNPGTFLDPTGVGVIGYPENPPKVAPGIFSQLLTVSDALYLAAVVPGTTLGTYKLKIFLVSTGAELAAGAYGFDSGNYCNIQVEF